jgi:hypothetical protein
MTLWQRRDETAADFDVAVLIDGLDRASDACFTIDFILFGNRA